MKNMTVVLRITLWYTLLMLVIVLLVLGFMFSLSNSVTQNDAKNRLLTMIRHNAEEIEYDDGQLEIDKDDFDFLENGVSSLVYSDTYELLYGQLPAKFPADTAFVDGDTQQVFVGAEQFLVYDVKITFKKHPDVWLRGVLPLDAVGTIPNSLMRLAFFALPFLVVLAGVGGYVIAHRAFLPVRKINKTVEAITEGRDLSRRVEVGQGQDEIHRLALNFNEMLKRLEDSFEAEKQFVSDVSHELRTPVSVILAQCEYALGMAPSAEDGTEALQVVQRHALRMHRLISHLLSITRMDQGALQTEFETVDLSELTQSLCGDQALLAPSHITLECDITKGIVAQVDIALYSRLLQNLLQNAMQYGKARVVVSLWESNSQVSLAVSDDGIGILPEDQSKIWRRFYQVNPSRTTAEAGSMGLGLAIVQQIAQLHQGEMSLRSKPGEGSTFVFTFPKK